MKTRLLVLAVLITAFMVTAIPASARDYMRGEDDCPVRIIAYAAHPFGVAADYIIARPVHWITKQIHLNKVFGNRDSNYEDKSFIWE